MRRTTRGRAVVSVTAATLGAVTLAVLPAQGAAAPAWPAGGYVPSCDSSSSQSAGKTRYTDTTPPTVGDVTFAGGRTTLAVAPRGTRMRFQARLTDECSGSAHAVLDRYRGRRYDTTVELTPNVTNGAYFDVVGRSQARRVSVSAIGTYTFRGGIARDRFSSFVLDSGHRLVSSVPNARWQLVPSSGPPLLVVRDTRLARPASDRMAKRARYTVAATLQVAGQVRWLPFPRKQVALQRRVSPGQWVDVRAVRSSSTGEVRARVRASQRTLYRFALAPAGAPGYWAGAASRPVTVG
jgi:hypothetical protein